MPPWAWGAIAAVIVPLLYFNTDTKVRRRKIRRTPRASAGALTEGTLVRVVGRARAASEPMLAPLTGRACVYYKVVVDHRTDVGSNYYVRGWRPFVEEERGAPFVIDDGTGAVSVDPAGAELALDFDRRTTTGAFHGADERQQAFMAAHGEKTKGWLKTKHYRYREAVIEVGEAIAVVGRVGRDTTGAHALATTSDAQLVITDDRAVTRGDR
jgi:hypothetical protein